VDLSAVGVFDGLHETPAKEAEAELAIAAWSLEQWHRTGHGQIRGGADFKAVVTAHAGAICSDDGTRQSVSATCEAEIRR
jgi:hypothetical protein